LEITLTLKAFPAQPSTTKGVKAHHVHSTMCAPGAQHHVRTMCTASEITLNRGLLVETVNKIAGGFTLTLALFFLTPSRHKLGNLPRFSNSITPQCWVVSLISNHYQTTGHSLQA
jgi:hypothetical protein